MAVIRSRPPETPFSLRECRELLGLSQTQFAAQLGVALETYRTWDSGRRPVRSAILRLANDLAVHHDPQRPLPFETVARLIHVHRRTLQAAARDGRLRVSYASRTTFRRLRARVTLVDAEQFRRDFFDAARWPSTRPPVLEWQDVPSDYSARIRRLRQQLGFTLGEFAARVGAARKAVVYQWESRKRCPSPVFWHRIQGLERDQAPL